VKERRRNATLFFFSHHQTVVNFWVNDECSSRVL